MKKASQLIYTACGKEKNGFFSTWAKSNDITAEEEREINDLMSYKIPRNADLPYEPTIEEADTLFPKKYAFIKLSTGRYCIAMSTYVGTVYSDNDARVGNYISHAFVLDDLNDFNPLNVILNPQFKRLLTYKEWHDDPSPTSLPIVNIKEGNEITSSEIKLILNNDNVHIFKCMLQACLDHQDDEETIVINDSDDKLPLWFKLIGLCAGKNYYKYTYVNMHIVNPMKPVSVKIAEMFKSGNYNFNSNIAYGLPVFNFETKAYNNNINISNYVEVLTNYLLEGDVSGAKVFISNIEKLTAKYGFSYDDAIRISMLFDGKMNNFSTPQELMSVIGLLNGKDYDINLVVSNILKVLNTYTKNLDLIPLYKYLYNNSNQCKNMVIASFMESTASFGVNKSSHTSYVDSLFANAPFTKTEYYQYILKNNEINSLIAKAKTDFNEEYLLLTLCCNNISENFSKGNNSISSIDSSVIDACIKQHIIQRDSKLSIVKDLLNSTDKRIFSNFLKRSIINIEKTESLVKYGLSYAFSLYQYLSVNEALAYYIKAYKLVTKEDYLKEFTRASQANPTFYNSLEAEMAKSADMKEFIEYKEYVELIECDDVTLSILDKIYAKYFANPNDKKNVFFNKLKIYLTNIPKDKRIAVSSDLYLKYIKKHELEYKNCKEIVQYLYDLIFELDYKEVFAQLKNYSTFITELHDRLQLKEDSNYDVIKKISLYQSCLNKKDASTIIDSITSTKQFVTLNSKGKGYIVDNYMDLVVGVISLCLTKDNFYIIFENVFADLTKESNFIGSTSQAISNILNKDEKKFNKFYYCYLLFSIKTRASKHLDVCKNVLSVIGKNKAEKLLVEIVDAIDSNPNFDENLYNSFINFVKEYEEANYTGFAKLFKKGILAGTKKAKQQKADEKKAKQEEKKRQKEEAAKKKQEEAEKKKKEKEAKEEKKKKVEDENKS